MKKEMMENATGSKINQKSQQKRDQIIIGRTGSNDGIIYSDCSIC